MYYYKKKSKDIIKYKVTIDEEKLTNLRYEIIEKCSTIIHKCYKTTRRPNEFDFEHIRNYSEKLVGKIEYNDFYSSPENEYLVEYDYYEHPVLISFIDSLLRGNTNMIDEIKNINIKFIDEEQLILEEQKKIIKSLNDISNKEIGEQLNLLNKNQKKLLAYKKHKELNRNQVSVNDYRKKVLACINLEEIERLSLKTVLEVIKFLCELSDKTVENDLNKVLKLNL